ncbi:MAG TPA: response regulator, partial [Pyrinomonadaceae bacterium]
NAIKFTANGGLVDVRLMRNDGSVEISVSDTGQGISAEFLPFIFDRFRQEDGTSTRRHGGLGLGLAIVRHLVELHGGTVHADSAGDGLGTCFTIRIPLPQQAKQPQRREAKVKSLFSSTRAAEKNSTTLPSLEGINVLLVDDDRDTLQILTILLREHRANVHAVASVGEAVEVLQWYRPDVVVSDLAMPDEDGFELIRKLRSNESLVKTPAIALTAYVRIEDRARALSAGYNMFVPKPVEPNELITAVANLVEPQVVTSEIA